MNSARGCSSNLFALKPDKKLQNTAKNLKLTPILKLPAKEQQKYRRNMTPQQANELFPCAVVDDLQNQQVFAYSNKYVSKDQLSGSGSSRRVIQEEEEEYQLCDLREEEGFTTKVAA